MKRVTASEARRRWFELLDQVVAGEEVLVERKGARVVIRREDRTEEDWDLPDYGELISVPEVEEADTWRWSWSDEEGELTLRGDDE